MVISKLTKHSENIKGVYMNHQLGQVGCALGSIKSHILQLQIMVSSYLVVSSSHSGKLPAVCQRVCVCVCVCVCVSLLL